MEFLESHQTRRHHLKTQGVQWSEIKGNKRKSERTKFYFSEETFCQRYISGISYAEVLSPNYLDLYICCKIIKEYK